MEHCHENKEGGIEENSKIYGKWSKPKREDESQDRSQSFRMLSNKDKKQGTSSRSFRRLSKEDERRGCSNRSFRRLSKDDKKQNSSNRRIGGSMGQRQMLEDRSQCTIEEEIGFVEDVEIFGHARSASEEFLDEVPNDTANFENDSSNAVPRQRKQSNDSSSRSLLRPQQGDRSVSLRKVAFKTIAENIPLSPTSAPDVPYEPLPAPVFVENHDKQLFSRNLRPRVHTSDSISSLQTYPISKPSEVLSWQSEPYQQRKHDRNPVHQKSDLDPLHQNSPAIRGRPRAGSATTVKSLQSALSPRNSNDFKCGQLRDNKNNPPLLRNLIENGFSMGLAKTFVSYSQSTIYDNRVWIIDNSGSMQLCDGHRIVCKEKKLRPRTTQKYKVVECSRWEEIQDTVDYHVHMASLLDSPTIFKLLNDPGSEIGPPQFSIRARGEAMINDELEMASKIMKNVFPQGNTPLTKHIWDLRRTIEQVAQHLIKEDKKVLVLLATDGLPSDPQGYGGDHITKEFIDALRTFENLPVSFIVRLCTTEEPVRKFYNSLLDAEMNISVDVLECYVVEAKEVYKNNPWINYALPLHRLRELGYYHQLFAVMGQRPFAETELKEFCGIIFGIESEDLIPNPWEDWMIFIQWLNDQQKKEVKFQWHPIKKKKMPWIDVKVLSKQYRSTEKCSIL